MEIECSQNPMYSRSQHIGDRQIDIKHVKEHDFEYIHSNQWFEEFGLNAVKICTFTQSAHQYGLGS
jgi:hypothetical protein